MKRLAHLKRLGFFTRLLDQAGPAERYRLATEQIVQAEKSGLDSAWIAQHHFHEPEGGLPAPFAFLGYVAARTSRIRLGTGIVTLPLESAVRVAEDAAVLDLICNGRFELGVGTGGNPSAFAAFGLDGAQRNEIFARRGRYFEAADLKARFGNFAWYAPNTWNSKLNAVEQANIALMDRIDKR